MLRRLKSDDSTKEDESSESAAGDLIIEIAHCRDLLVADRLSSDPYVNVVLGGLCVHKTKFVAKNLNPIFTPKHDSLFHLPSSELTKYESEGLVLVIKDHDTLGTDDSLGTVRISADALRDASTTRRKKAGEMTLDVVPPKDRRDENAGKITIRSRSIRDFEERFVRHLKKGKPSSAYSHSSKDKLLKSSAPRERDPPPPSPDEAGGGKFQKGFNKMGVGAARAFKTTVSSTTSIASSIRSTSSGGAAAAGSSFAARAATTTTDLESLSDEDSEGEEGREASTSATTTITDRSRDDDDSETEETRPSHDPDDLIIEIKACSNLIAADLGMFSDPYVKVKVGKRYFHRTKHRRRTLNPTYSPKQDSLFYLSSKQLTKHESTGGVTLKVMDHDAASADDELGSVQIPCKTLKTHANRMMSTILGGEEGGKLTFQLTPPPSKKGKVAGSITIGCRQASDYDETFRRHLEVGKHSSSYRDVVLADKRKSKPSLLKPTKTKKIRGDVKSRAKMARKEASKRVSEARAARARSLPGNRGLSQPLLRGGSRDDSRSDQRRARFTAEKEEDDDADDVGFCSKVSKCCHSFKMIFTYVDPN